MQTLYIIFVICKVQSFIFTSKWKLWIPPDIGSINLVILMVGETVAPTGKTTQAQGEYAYSKQSGPTVLWTQKPLFLWGNITTEQPANTKGVKYM